MIKLSLAAKFDLIQISSYYAEIDTNLAERFLRIVESKIELIHNNPHLFQAVYKDFRRALINKFPYAVFYKIHDHDIIVHRVISQKSGPDMYKTI